MNNKTITVTLDEDTYATFQDASEIVSKAGIRVPTSQLVQVMLNAEMRRLHSRKVAQRFLKSVMQQIGGLAGNALDDDDDNDAVSEISSAVSARP
jgi:hypothetical protein